MTNRMRILFVDDQPEMARSASEQLPDFVKAQADIEVLDLAAATSEIEILFKRYRKFLGGSSFADVVKEFPSRVDGADLLILDYDLKDTSQGGEWASGLEVARTARAFSTARAIVLLNQFRGSPKFDLTMTEGMASFADLDVPRMQLANPGLWSSANFGGFRPWSWPDLSREHQRFEALCKWTTANLDRPVLEALGLNAGTSDDDDPTKTMARETWTSVMSEPKATFRQLIEKGGFVPPNYSDQLMKDQDAAPRVAASIFSRWFERSVWRSQDVFVDAPHLAHLAPWLLKKPEDRDHWAGVCVLEEASLEFFVDGIKEFMVPESSFASRPLFHYGEMQASGKMGKPHGFSFSVLPRLEFCEDVSQFLDPDATLTFPTLLLGGYSVRFVCDQAKFPGNWSDAQNPKNVDYVPQSLFAL